MPRKRRTAIDLIRAARAAQAARAGVRVKVRLPDALAARARECAAEIGYTLGDWVNAACRQHRSGVFDSVAIADNAPLATRNDSEAVTVRAPDKMSAADIKTAIARACAFCEARRIVYNPQPPARYLLEK